MNEKKFFIVGIIILILGGGVFLMTVIPSKKTNSDTTQTPTITQKTIQPPEKKKVDEVIPPQTLKENTTAQKNEPEIPKQQTNAEILESAEEFFAKGMYSNAIEVAQKISPPTPKSLHILVDSHMKLTQYITAENHMKDLILQENVPQNTVQYIEILLLSGKVENAKQVIALLPSSEEKTFYNLIISTVEENNNAIKKYAQKLLDSNSQYAKTAQEFFNIFENYSSFRDGSPHYLRAMMANMLNILGYHALCVDYLKPTLLKYPEYRDAWILAGNSYLSLKKFDLAVKMLEKAVSLDPSHSKSPYFLAIALAETGAYEASVEQFKNALKNGYTPIAKVERYIGDTLVRQKKFDEAIEHYQEAIYNSKTPEIRDYIQSITISLNELQSPDMALKLATQMGKEFPQNAQSFSFLGWALLENKNYDSAKKTLATAIEKDNTLAAPYLFMGQIYEVEQNYDSAFSAYKKGYEKDKGGIIARECAQKFNTLKEKLQNQQ